MAKIFKNDETALIAEGRCPKGVPPDIVKSARRKIAMVRAAVVLNDLRSPPGNKLHPLAEDRAGQHGIWVNDQFRICFVWTEHGAEEIEFTDYH